MTSSAPVRIEKMISVFAERGSRHYGENVSELEQALQAAEFARMYGEPESLVLACLLHDYGHMLHDLGEEIAQQGVDARHEELGARLLAGSFPEEILEPIRQHVASKRYLCWKDPSYLAGLSESSKLSFQLQGGPMTNEEASEFEANPHFESCLRLRRYDDMGKVPGMTTATLESYVPIIERYLQS